jgi:2-keto-4-pentenoate hydratase/2-oxohepta-3-ene-1,7-dioic acid hydratase in catechol pathway
VAVSFGLVTYAAADGPRVGVLVNDRIGDADGLLAALPGGGHGLQAVLDHWDAALPRLTELAEAIAAGRVQGLPAAATRLLAPLPRPINLYCAFANYVDHMKEMGGEPADKTAEDPFVFQTPVNAVSNPGDPICIPPGVTRTDWEGELAAVIGREARNLTPETALSCVAGYTIIHDVSIRGGARRGANGGRPDFLASKGRASFKPMGPALIPAAFIPDPQALRLRTWVSGELKQDSSTAQMIFTTAELIAWVSQLIGVVPGDLFATGTPAGVGMPRGTFLTAGDVVEIEIERIGRLSNPVTGG